ncbi:MAG TPA: signal recognition particle-docking protein FtsY [Ktedonobacterales bacterium]|nr:signal recognition particle-docking protein FtsY [Ktedonobacterales bacterium]
MFKRVRDNLFGRPEDEVEGAPAAEAAEPAAAEPADEAADVSASGAMAVAAAEPAPPASVVSGAAVPAAPVVMRVPADPASPRADAQPSAGLAPPSATTAAPAELHQVEDEEDADAHAGVSFFRNPFKLGLGRTRALFGRVNEALAADDISDDLWDELEETLISSDVGVTTTERLLQTLRERVAVEHLQRGAQLRQALKEELELLLGDPEPLVFSDTSPLTVFLVVGVNGVGKTTSIAKLANVLKRQKHRVMLAAGDTFRAAATEQIKTWGERIGVPVISHQHGADPAAVVYDSLQAAQARDADVLIVDTAGRLHTKFNLMEELKKIGRVLAKYDPEAPHEVLLVIDATTGQNGFLQAKQFVADAGVSGVILTKLDGTARGGIVLAIASELGVPIKYVGVGEGINDLAPFDSLAFVDALFEAN